MINNFDEMIKNDALVVFYTNWCGECRLMDEEIKNIDNIKIIKVDADKNRNIVKKYGIMSVPTLVYFKDGESYIKNGFMNKENILKWIESYSTILE